MATFSLGSRRVVARPWPLLLMLLGVGALAGLGTWQLGRADQKRALVAAFAAGNGPAQPLALGAPVRYARVEARGEYLVDRQFLLDNMTHAGQAGYRVLTPLLTPAGTVLLVDRGWLPPGAARERLPDVAVAAGPRTVSGRLDELPRAGLHLQALPEPGWPRRISYPTRAELERALGRPLYAHILLLDPSRADGYLRDWQPPGPTPERHLGYALQWYALALTLMVLFFFAHLTPRESAR